MKFAKNRLYIESYTKCPNCGILIFENSESNMKQTIFVDGRRYCSSWCVAWEEDRAVRRQAEAVAQ